MEFETTLRSYLGRCTVNFTALKIQMIQILSEIHAERRTDNHVNVPEG